ncbi:MAG TPA: ATP-binding protein [Terriglobia bacterium]|nr:ATP-binding protein [Terriglobia bacterium]
MGAASWQKEVPVTRSVHLPPAPRLMDAIGHHHAFETAVADLIDNCIDAKARAVLVRFVREAAPVTSLVLADDGRGIPESEIDAAMTMGGDRDYDTSSLGHYGMGLKAASFSQADSLTVLSRDATGTAVGRRWLLERARTSFECDIVDPRFALTVLSRPWGPLRLTTGTVVRWDNVRTFFPTVPDHNVTEAFLQDTIELLIRHLGLVFHRILAAGRIQILIDVEDVTTGATGASFNVVPVDPFGYTRTGHAGYPKKLTATYHGQSLALECHIWPGRSQVKEFRLGGGRSAEPYQGFYFYRNDRLVQMGGWNGVHHGDREHQLARVAVDISDAWACHLRMNPEKSALTADPQFTETVGQARSEDGTTFPDFLTDAREAYKQSRKRSKERPKTVAPGKGFHPNLRRALDDELEYLAGVDPFDIRWKDLDGDSFLEVDREHRTLWLNKRYRVAVTGYDRGALNDAPVLKVLLYLLTQEVFKGAWLGPRDKDNIELWQRVLTAAARAELP